MSGRGRGKRAAGSVGPGRPAKYPHTTNSNSTSNPEQQAQVQPSQSGGGGLVEILNQLDSNKRNEMLSLVGQYKNRGLNLNDFMMRARELLGDRLYAQLSRDMNSAAAARGAVQVSSGSGNSIMNNIATLPTAAMMTPMSMIPPPHGVSTLPSSSIMRGPMHSMPQIYGGPLMPPSSSSSQFPLQPQSHQVVEVDVTKMDTSSLQDVMQYSGVDLKAEAELLYREHQEFNTGGSVGGYVDHRLKFDYFFNPFKFRAIVQHALQRHFFSNSLSNNNTGNGTQESTSTATNTNGKLPLLKPLGITEEAVHLLGIAIQKRLIGILRRLAEISRHRVDYGRGRFKIKIENDPKKQIWLQEKLFIEGIGEDKRKLGTSAVSTPNSNQTLLNPPSLATVLNKSGPTAAQSKTSTSQTGTTTTGGASASNTQATGSNAADDSVKTKLANVTAMAALGIRQKSWMSSATPTGSSTGNAVINPSGAANTTSSSSSAGGGAGTSSTSPTADEKDPTEVYQHPLANFYSLPSSTPLTDTELRTQYFNRTISTVDLITCMESDPHLRKSRLLAVLYDALPRENKENSSNNNNINNDS